MRSHARKTLPKLIQAAGKEDDRAAREAQIHAAARLDPFNAAVLDLLAAQLAYPPDPKLPFRSETPESLLRAAGKDALPALRRALHSNAPRARLIALSILALGCTGNSGTNAHPPWTIVDVLPETAVALQDKDAAVRACAAEFLNAAGPAAASVVDALDKALQTEPLASPLRRTLLLARANVARAPGSAVCRTPLDAFPLNSLLALAAAGAPDQAERAEREDALLALRLHGGGAPDAADAALAVLGAALDGSQPRARRAALRALGGFGARATALQAFLPRLGDALNSEPKTRQAALDALAELGRAAAPLEPALVRHAAEDAWLPEPEFEDALARALQPHAALAAPALAGYVRTGAPEVRARAARALGLLGSASVSAIPALVALTESGSDDEAQAAFDALRRIGVEQDPGARAAILAVLRNSLYATRRAWAAAALGPPQLRRKPDLAQAVKPPVLDEAGEVVDALPNESADALVAALNDVDEQVRRVARDTLLSWGDAGAAKLAVAAQQGPQPQALWAARTLARMRERLDAAGPQLIALLGPEFSDTERADAAELLRNYGASHTRPADRARLVPPLVWMLRARADLPARTAMETLKPFGAEARPLVERLRFDRDPRIRLRAARMLELFE
jgi:hypothetical protein